MTATIEELTTPLSRQEVQQSIYDVLGAIGVNTTSWKSGAPLRTMIVAVSIVLASFSKLTALIAKSGFVELSEGAWLTLVAKHVFNVDREGAAFATGEITLVNASGGIYVVDADDLTFATAAGVEYRNTTPFTLTATSSITVPIQAVEVGTASSAGPGAITVMQTPLTGVTCSNANALVGRDPEKDAPLQQRCSEKLGALSPMGPWDAYSFAVRNAPRADGSIVPVNRVRFTKDGFGNVTIYCATPTGLVQPADLVILDEAVQQLAAPLAVTAYTLSATAVPVAVEYEVWMYNTSALTEAQVQAAITSRLLDFMASQPIGGNVIDPAPGKIFRDAIRAAIAAAAPEIFHVELAGDDDVTPPPDTELGIGEVAVLSGDPTAIAIHQVPPPQGRS